MGPKHITTGVSIVILISHSGTLRDLPQDKQQTSCGPQTRTPPAKLGALWSLLCDQKTGLWTDSLSLVYRGWDGYACFRKGWWQHSPALRSRRQTSASPEGIAERCSASDWGNGGGGGVQRGRDQARPSSFPPKKADFSTLIKNIKPRECHLKFN